MAVLAQRNGFESRNFFFCVCARRQLATISATQPRLTITSNAAVGRCVFLKNVSTHRLASGRAVRVPRLRDNNRRTVGTARSAAFCALFVRFLLFCFLPTPFQRAALARQPLPRRCGRLFGTAPRDHACDSNFFCFVFFSAHSQHYCQTNSLLTTLPLA